MDNNKKCKWIIISDGYDSHYIKEELTWKDAILSHIEWCYNPSNLSIYYKMLTGFDDMLSAIEMFNTVFNCEKIQMMIPINDDCYIDEKAGW